MIQQKFTIKKIKFEKIKKMIKIKNKQNGNKRSLTICNEKQQTNWLAFLAFFISLKIKNQ